MSGFQLWREQVLTILSLEWTKSLFARRGLWVYGLALLPALLLGLKAYQEQRRYAEYARVLARTPQAPEVSKRIQIGMKSDDAAKLLSENQVDFSRFNRGKREFIRYNDGQASYELLFRDGVLRERRNRMTASLGTDIQAYAGIFQFFYLRLAIFFGCVEIFMNLFRGEMLDQSLHYYLLAPVRREVLLAGKYLSGLIATTAIFGASFLLQYWLLLMPHPDAQVSQYLSTGGWGHVFTYLGVVAMACVGYGSVFLAAGLFVKNPLIPAAAILVWEGMNWFLPSLLKKFSVIFYLQSLCPVVAPPNSEIPEPLKLLVTTTAPTPGPIAVAGILTLAAAILALAMRRARRLEINYSSD
jgi:hypothetical protein